MADQNSRTSKRTSTKPNQSCGAKKRTASSNTPARKVKKTLPLDTLVRCVSAVANGKLIYESKRLQGCTFEWDKFGDEQDIELAELQAMRNAYPAFFEKNWILIDDKEVLEFLHVDKYYKFIYSVEDFESIFHSSPAQVNRIVPHVGSGLKEALAFEASQRYRDGRLDSNSLAKALEQTTGYRIVDM